MRMHCPIFLYSEVYVSDVLVLFPVGKVLFVPRPFTDEILVIQWLQ